MSPYTGSLAPTSSLVLTYLHKEIHPDILNGKLKSMCDNGGILRFPPAEEESEGNQNDLTWSPRKHISVEYDEEVPQKRASKAIRAGSALRKMVNRELEEEVGRLKKDRDGMRTAAESYEEILESHGISIEDVHPTPEYTKTDVIIPPNSLREEEDLKELKKMSPPKGASEEDKAAWRRKKDAYQKMVYHRQDQIRKEKLLTIREALTDECHAWRSRVGCLQQLLSDIRHRL